MAYETDAASDIDDLMMKLDAFLVANGWTQDQLALVSNKAAWHKGDLYISMRWDASGNIGVYQATGYTGGNDPGNHPGDSGNGLINATISSQRRISGIGAGPFTAYHFFQDDTTVECVHIVLEWQPEYFRHISFGDMIKVGTWTGGAYATTIDWNTVGSNASDLLNTSHHVLFDMIHANSVQNVGTVRVEGLSFQGGATKWGVFWNGSTAPGNDRGGTIRTLMGGGFRDGPLHELFCGIRATPSNGFVPMYPVWVFARDRSVSPEDDIFLGTIPNIRGLNVRFIEPAEIITFGSDDWMCFPWVRKANLGSTSQESKYQGIAIKKVA
jgi:hypothetical protein